MAPGLRASLRPIRFAWVVLGVSLALVAVLWLWVREDARRHAQHLAGRQAAQLASEIRARAEVFRALAQGTALAARVPGGPQGVVFKDVLEEVAEGADLPKGGALGVCLMDRGPKGVERCVTVAVSGPSGGPSHLLMLDHLSIPERAEAMRRAAETGKVALTAPLRLMVDDARKGPRSVILYAPIHSGDRPPGVRTAPSSSPRGFAFCAIPMEGLARKVRLLRDDDMDAAVWDTGTGALLYHSPGWTEGPRVDPSEDATAEVELDGRIWRIALRPALTGFAGDEARSPGHVLILGLVASFLAFLVALLLEGARASAVRLAERMAGEARAGEARIRGIAETMGEGLYVVDAQGVVTYVNPEGGRLLGWTPEELMGRNAHELFHRQSADGHQNSPEACGILRVARLGGRYESEEEVYWHRDDHPVSVAVNASSVMTDGRPQGAVVVFRDVSERKRALAAVAHAQKLESLELMAGGIAHDFNNLFQGLLGNLELALMDVPEGTTAAGCLKRMEDILARAARLSGEMLLYSGRGHLQREALDLAGLVRQVAEGRAEMDLDGDLPLLEGDPGQIRKLLSILLENATEAAGGGPVRLRLRRVVLTTEVLEEGHWPEPGRPGPTVMIEVEDPGPGIPPDVQRRVFDPFFSTKAVGRGLGLPAALGILRGHQGQIQVLSAPGQGTRVRVYLPVREPMAGAPPDAPPRPARGTLLLVDDEVEVRTPVSELLRARLGYGVLEAASGEEAVALFRANADRIALVLMDATMPGLDGLRAFDAIREIRPGARGILCSGYGEEAGRAAMAQHGFAAYLRKPFALKDLEALLNRLLGEP